MNVRFQNTTWLWIVRAILMGVSSLRPASGRMSAFLNKPASLKSFHSPSVRGPINQGYHRMTPPLMAYEPSPMDPNVILSQLAVIGVSGAAAAVWWYVLVPAKRTELARDKRAGPLNDYLEDLREEETRADGRSLEGGKKVERWLLSDWLSPDTTRKAAALPFLPKAKFNSGDNPILAAAALIMMTGIIFSVLGWT
eukprot:CAMPEP_0185774068 /NCGR_PEP_ID=MMETSP1174-20130828/76590_1 /TAXON_ID=35687 /ORGANISM="Dictyocha speculum, Strain CCMP1381" /LENGTH=195 /DNA_ID=CAMNT_0028461069 /DNA_START=9 /DNA_END=596 /DNA_ORIENTATION=-